VTIYQEVDEFKSAAPDDEASAGRSAPAGRRPAMRLAP
jgi:hypothetical protein